MTLPSNMTSSLSLYWSCTELCSRNAQSCHTVMSLKSLNLSLPWSSQPHMVQVSHPVMQSPPKVAMILPPTSMGPDSQTSWLPSICAGCFREVRSRSTTPCTTVINARLHILTSQPLYWSCHDYAPPQLASPGLHPEICQPNNIVICFTH